MRQRIPSSTWILLGLCCALLVLVPLALAQSDSGYDLSWWTVDGGGGVLSAPGAYTLAGTIAQPDVDLLGGGGYTLTGGFWVGIGSAAPDYDIYLPMVVRGQP